MWVRAHTHTCTHVFITKMDHVSRGWFHRMVVVLGRPRLPSVSSVKSWASLSRVYPNAAFASVSFRVWKLTEAQWPIAVSPGGFSRWSPKSGGLSSLPFKMKLFYVIVLGKSERGNFIDNFHSLLSSRLPMCSQHKVEKMNWGAARRSVRSKRGLQAPSRAVLKGATRFGGGTWTISESKDLF